MLALLGIVIGVGTVIGMVALINGFQRSFQQSIQSFGNNTIYIRRIRPGISFGGDVPDSLQAAPGVHDGRRRRRSWRGAPAVRAIAPFKWPCDDLQAAATRPAARAVTFVYGTNENYLLTHGYDLARGPVLHRGGGRPARATSCVLGKDTREALFRDASGLGRAGAHRTASRSR